ncbi:hypothetical protein Bca52824_008994 [Brassica carinata]|uniref:JAB1/MPN/MOV34 metalloenzyme domain-containing protein n=1 Tax=Brassica carinata TaxID=52824 RepID=A0A8X7WA69_BRACI|nr:hypothetical protein Bca52824_008994 [Brassica carinata]
MLASHHPKEIIGWYSTGLGVNGGSALTHDLYLPNAITLFPSLVLVIMPVKNLELKDLAFSTCWKPKLDGEENFMYTCTSCTIKECTKD